MPSARSVAGEMMNMFTPANFKKNQREVVLTFVEVKPAPKDYRAPFIAKVMPEAEKDHVALNKTNVNKLIELIGDDYGTWGGYDVTFQVAEYEGFSPGLVVTDAKKSKRKVPF